MKQRLLLLYFAVLTILVSNAQDNSFTATNEDGVNLAYCINGDEISVTHLPNQHYRGHITIPSRVTYCGYTYLVTSIGDNAFYNCTGLTSVNIPNSVTSIGNCAFYDCTGLTSVNIPNSVTSIGDYAFYGCTTLTEVTIPNSVTTIGEAAFADCTGLTSVTIGDSITSIPGGFCADCKNLSSVSIGSSVVSIELYAFYNCNNITKVYITNLENWCQMDIRGVDFEELYRWGNIILSDAELYINGQLAENIVIPDTVTAINYAFSLCRSIKSVTIPNSVTSIGDYAFYGCTGLTSVNIPNSVTSIRNGAFYGCIGLTSVNIPNSVTSIGYGAFMDCTGLTSVTIPNSVTTIGDSAFDGCSSLTSATIPNSVTSIGSCTFSDCASLTSITLPESLTYIGPYTFSDCASLTSITLPNALTSISKGTFNGCTNLVSFEIPGKITEIGESAFSGTGLTSIVIPNSVTEYGNSIFSNCANLESAKIYSPMTSIPSEAFSGCERLAYVSIPECVETINDKAFYGCVSLSRIDCYNGSIAPSCGTEVFDKSIYPNCFLHVPAAAKPRYYGREPWANFAHIENLSETPYSLILNYSHLAMKIEKSTRLIAAYNPQRAEMPIVRFSSSDTSVATVENDGTVKAVSPGSAVITATDQTGLTATCKVTVESLSYSENQIYAWDVTVYDHEMAEMRVSYYSLTGVYEYRVNIQLPIGAKVKGVAFGPAVKVENFTNEWNVEGNVLTLHGVYGGGRRDVPAEAGDTEFARISIDTKDIELGSYRLGLNNQYLSNEVDDYLPDAYQIDFVVTTTPPTKCETPLITITENGNIVVTCPTEGAVFHTTITSDDINEFTHGNEEALEMTGLYRITTYATADWLENSDTVTATLAWVKNYDATNGDDVIEVGTERAILLKSIGENISITGTVWGEPIEVYTIGGVRLYSGKAADGDYVIPTPLTKGEVYIVVVGDRSIKYRH